MMQQEIVNTARQLIGKYLKSVRKDKGLTVYAVSKISGLQRAQIQAIEKGDSSYTIDSFIRIIQALDVYFFMKNKDGDDDQIDFKISAN